jgi:hypothetical protein
MTSTISKRVRELLDRLAVSVGFVKHSTWLWTKGLEDGSLTLILYLQKSNFGNAFSIELGALLKEVPDNLRIWHSPLRMNCVDCAPDQRWLLSLLDFNRATDADVQIRELGAALKTGLLAEVGLIRSRHDLLTFIKNCQERVIDGKRSVFLVSKDFLDQLINR